ncbi:transposase [Microbacteriaceae bacterium 4G12]
MKDPPTITRYRDKPIQQYLPLVHKYESQGSTVKDSHLFLKEQRYTGTFSAVRTAVETIRRNRKRQQQTENLHKVPRNKLAGWIWVGDAKLNILEQADFQRCLQTYPALQPLYQMIQEYRTIIESNNYDVFLSWLRKQLSNKEMPFYQYVRRLRSDLEAVKHAFLLTYSNGVLEGQVDRVKVIKRLLYGKAGLYLLQKRVLYDL